MEEKVDPIENDPAFRAIIDDAEKDILNELKKRGHPTKPEHPGWCHLYWSVKQEVLKEKYGFEWKSPAEMNPEVRYD